MPFLQSGAALLELSCPECGTVVGYPPAGCEVCREAPCSNESSALAKTEPHHVTHALARDKESVMKNGLKKTPSCEAGHMGASDLIKALQKTPCEEGAVHIWGMRYLIALGTAWRRGDLSI